MRRLASGSANGATRGLTRLVRATGSLRWTTRRRKAEKMVRRGRVMDEGRGRRKSEGMRGYNVQTSESIERIMAEHSSVYERSSV